MITCPDASTSSGCYLMGQIRCRWRASGVTVAITELGSNSRNERDQMRKLTSVLRKEDVTDEIIDIVLDVVEGWYNEGRIDWEDVWDRSEGAELKDGTELDFGTDLASPAMREIKKRIRSMH